MPHWTPSEQALAQTNHVLIAGVILLWCTWKKWPRWHDMNELQWGIIFVLAWAVVKEFAIDLVLEGDSIANGEVDFLGYFIGAACWAILIHAVRVPEQSEP